MCFCVLRVFLSCPSSNTARAEPRHVHDSQVRSVIALTGVFLDIKVIYRGCKVSAVKIAELTPAEIASKSLQCSTLPAVISPEVAPCRHSQIALIS